MKTGLYAGSFDPWTHGHKFVLDSALDIFDCVHIVTAFNPAKQSVLKPDTRARIIANTIDPYSDWWAEDPPFHVNERIIVDVHGGLVADYAAEKNVYHLIRGLRSTTDFESEFNLYFSNQAIDPKLQTWAIMCPPRLLHCSSTYVKTVVGKSKVKFVGTSFTSQSLILGWVRIIGRIFDLIEISSKHRFDVDPMNLTGTDLHESLQLLFSNLWREKIDVTRTASSRAHKILDSFLRKNKKSLLNCVFEIGEYPENEINFFWAVLALCMSGNASYTRKELNGVSYLLSLAQNLGKTPIRLFDEDDVVKEYEKLLK